MVQVVQSGFGVRVTGTEQLLRDLRRVAPDLNRELRKELRRIGNEVAAAAKGNIPATPPMSRMARVPRDPVSWHAKYNKDRRVRQRDGGWPEYNSSAIAAGIKVRTAKPKGVKDGALLYILNSDPAGAIYEMAGRKNDPTPRTAGSKFIAKLNAEGGDAGRVIWRAYDEGGAGKIKGAVIRAVENAEKALAERYGDGGYAFQQR